MSLGDVAGIAEPDGAQVIAAMRAAIEGIKQRGKRDLGDKTLLDALVPAADALEQALQRRGRAQRPLQP